MVNIMYRLLRPIKAKLILLVAKAVVTLVKDSESIQLVQVDLGNDEVIDSVERVQNFGFTSFPESGAKAIVLSIGGEREHPIVIVADDNGDNRPTLAEGEAAVYNAYGRIVKLKNGDIEIGVNTFKKLIKEEFQTMFNNHIHNVSTSIGGVGTTSSPVSLAGVLPITVPSSVVVAIVGDAIGNSEMTSILKAE